MQKGRTGLGTVVWFSSVGRYGFVKPDTGHLEIFVRDTAQRRAVYAAGERVKYEFVSVKSNKTEAEIRKIN